MKKYWKLMIFILWGMTCLLTGYWGIAVICAIGVGFETMKLVAET